MANNGRLGLSPLSINKDQLARVGELLSNKNDGILYIKLNDGSIVPVKGDSYFRFQNFYEEFWNPSDIEPTDSPSHTWLNTDGYDKNMEDLNAVLMVKTKDAQDNFVWKAMSLHSKADSVLIDEETSETLEDFVNRHSDFYENIFNLDEEDPNPNDPNAKKHWIKSSGIEETDGTISGAIMIKSNDENNDYLALSPTTLSEDVIVDIEKGHSLKDILPNIYDMKDELELFMELKDKIILNADLEERVSNNEYGIVHAHDFTKDEIADLRSELTDLMESKDEDLDDALKIKISDLRAELESVESNLSTDISSLSTELRSRILQLQNDLDQQDINIQNHSTTTILNSAVHGMRVNSNDELEYAIGNNTWVSVIRSDELGKDDGVATLNSDGIVPSSQLPSALSPEIFIVSSIAERTTLNPNHGDECYITETERRYIWDQNDTIWLPRKSQHDLFSLTWDSIENKPSSFTPESHGNEAHAKDYVAESNLRSKMEELGISGNEQFMRTWGGM